MSTNECNDTSVQEQASNYVACLRILLSVENHVKYEAIVSA